MSRPCPAVTGGGVGATGAPLISTGQLLGTSVQVLHQMAAL